MASGYNDSVGFFESLSFIGWMGILLWVLFIIFVIVKYDSFINFEQRIPKMEMWDKMLYEDWHIALFMIGRFFVMLLALYVITKIMFIL